MSSLRNTHAALYLLLAAAPGCASPLVDHGGGSLLGGYEPPRAAGTRDETLQDYLTRQDHCARVAALPHRREPPVKVAGNPAYLTPDGIAAGLTGTVSMVCNVSRKGRLFCALPKSIPPSQAASIDAALETWRFRPATYDGAPIAESLDLALPLVVPPPQWKAPEPAPRMVVVPLELNKELTPPVLVSGPSAPPYTRDMVEHCAEGKVVARCTITREGRLVDCDIIKSAPYIDEVVLDTLSQQRYSPILYRGQPQSVFYTLSFRFKLP